MRKKPASAHETTYSGRLGELSKRELATLARSVPVTSHWALRDYRLRFHNRNAPLVVTFPGVLATLVFFGVFLLPHWWLVIILLGPAAILSVLAFFGLTLALHAVVPKDEHLVFARQALRDAKAGDATAQNLAVELTFGDDQYFGNPAVSLPELPASWVPRRSTTTRFAHVKAAVRQEFQAISPAQQRPDAATSTTSAHACGNPQPGSSAWSKELLSYRSALLPRVQDQAASVLPLINELATLLDPTLDPDDDALTRHDRQQMRTDLIAAVQVYSGLPADAVAEPLTGGRSATTELTELLQTFATTARTHHRDAVAAQAEQLAYLNRLNSSRFKASNLDFE